MSSVTGAQGSSISDHLETQTLRNWLTQEPFTLTLSSGFFGFFAHCGVLSALIEEGLIPTSATGSSAGALVSGVWASGRSIHELKEALFEVRREDFWDPAFGLGLLRGELFEEKLRQLLACEVFSETVVPLRLTAFHCGKLRARVFSQGELAPAIRASCTFPGLFQPVWIEGAPYIDGGVSDRPGWSGLNPDVRVLYHHLVSRSRLRSNLGLTRVPQRKNTVALVMNHLPRCSPKDLSAGPAAFSAAREATLNALDLSLSQNPEEASVALRLNALKFLSSS
jgi:NTE family protein